MALPMNRTQALDLLKEYTTSPSLVKHALAVEATMRHFAVHYKEDEVYWGIVGLLHDLDYEKHPKEHCKVTPYLLRENGFDEEFIHSVLSHGYGLCTDVEPVHIMEKVLYTVDELTGLVTACALVRPSRSLMDLELKSVKKKFKDGAFAAAVNREVIKDGAARMEMPLDEVISHTILALRTIADKLELAGV